MLHRQGWPRVIGLGLALVPGLGLAQFTEKELLGIDDMLFVGNMTRQHLVVERRIYPGMPMISPVRVGLSDPIGASQEFMGKHATAGKASSAELLRLAAGMLDVTFTPQSTAAPAQTVAADLPPGLKAIVEQLGAAVAQCDAEIRAACERLSPAEQRQLIESLPTLALEEPSIPLGFVRSQTLGLAQTLALADRIDMPRMLRAAERLAASVESATAKLQANKEEVAGKVKTRVGTLPMVIAGRGSDLHDDLDARITIDLGGDDRYTGRHGAGVGYSSVLIDLSGDDSYSVPDLSIGAAALGVGIAVDAGGNDDLRGQSVNFGAGIGGVGVFVNQGGDDTVSHVALGSGFGMVGIGLCIDTAGHDSYRCELFGQGAGRTRGVGWLVDRAGRDTYRADGRIMNSPLFTGVAYSFSQGFGMGYREDSGGVAGGAGFLTDVSGNDRYLADSYAQGASYWFAVGSLYDAEGSDTYSGHHYVQASAMHLTSAYLFDLGGDDSYTVKVGAAQGIGHDYGVSLLFDRAGDDLYASKDARPGTGVANGLGLFIEGAGIDTYTALPAFGREDRGMPSYGLFLDLSGADKYPVGMNDGWGFATALATAFDQDLSTPVGTDVPPPPVTPDPEPGSKPMPTPQEMDRLYRLASQWGVGSAQTQVEAALRDLIAIGMPGYDWLIANRLRSVQRLQVRAWGRLTRALGAPAVSALGAKALEGVDADIEPVIRVAIEANATDIGALLPGIIRDKPALRLLAIRAAGALKARGATDSILPHLISEDPILVRTSMVALSQLGDSASLGTASTMLGSTDPYVREAAIRLIVSQPEMGFKIGQALVGEPDEQRARLGIIIMGRINMYNALDEIGKSLLDPRPGVRITAMLQLEGRCPTAFRETLLSLRDDPIPAVRAVAKKVNP